MKHLKGTFLELVLDLRKAYTFGKRRVDVHRLACDPDLLFRFRDEGERAHVVGAIRQLHQQNADILAHRKEKLSEILRLRTARQGLDGQPAELCNAVDKLRDVTAELAVESVEGHIAIFDGIMKKRRDDAFLVKPHVGEDVGHRNRMCEIGFAGGTRLAVMRYAPEIESTRQAIGVHRRVIRAHLFYNWISRSDHHQADRYLCGPAPVARCRIEA